MKTIFKISLLSTLFLFVMSCSKEDDLIKQAELGSIIELKIGEQGKIEDIDLCLDFSDILQDSRCPTNTACFWEGQAEVQFNLQMDGKPQELILVSRAGSPQEAEKTIGERKIRLVSVSPYPKTSEPIPKEDYIITVVID